MGHSDAELRRLLKLKYLKENFEAMGRHCLRIRSKEQEIVPFEFNTPQKYLHKRAEEQKKRLGRVRLLVLKGRQQGISTYVGCRFYAKASMNKNRNVYIMAHAQDSSEALFKIVERLHRHNRIAPHTGASNAKELVFDRLDSSYSVGTAGQKAGGRGKTPTLYHGSEVAFWPNAQEHFAASVQGVPDLPGTEIILESTANGPSGEFFERWQDAMARRSDYEAVFIPWFWSPEYRRDDLVDENFELSPEKPGEGELSEVEYADMFELDDAQMAWRRSKIAELRSHSLFKQEYPATPDEAFQASNTDAYISAPLVLRARKRTDIEGAGPLILGVDPAGPGGDRFAVAARRGHVVEWVKWRDKIETAEAHAWLVSLIDEHDPARVFIDAGGIGYPTISLLRADGPRYARVVEAVNFGGKSQFKTATPRLPGPINRRAEMYMRLKEWLELEEGVSLPDMDVLQGDLVGVQRKRTLNNDLQLVSKDEMRSKGIRSPDLGDAVALTFASLRHIKDYSEPSKPVPAGNPDVARRAQVRQRSSRAGRNSWMMR